MNIIKRLGNIFVSKRFMALKDANATTSLFIKINTRKNVENKINTKFFFIIAPFIGILI